MDDNICTFGNLLFNTTIMKIGFSSCSNDEDKIKLVKERIINISVQHGTGKDINSSD